jgi:hypothetical protein
MIFSMIVVGLLGYSAMLVLALGLCQAGQD